MNYLRPAVGERLLCTARVIQKGRSIAVVEAEIADGEGLVAKALGTFAILSRREQREDPV
jgi:acyl-CoA thioesterase